MTESVNKISVISALMGDGSGLADKRKRSRRKHWEDDHDTVLISAEARILCACEETEDTFPDDTVPEEAENGEN